MAAVQMVYRVFGDMPGESVGMYSVRLFGRESVVVARMRAEGMDVRFVQRVFKDGSLGRMKDAS